MMTRTISPAEHRAVVHENDARVAIENADIDLAAAEAAILGEVAEAGDVSPVNQRLLKAYAEARDHLGRAAKVLAP